MPPSWQTSKNAFIFSEVQLSVKAHIYSKVVFEINSWIRNDCCINRFASAREFGSEFLPVNKLELEIYLNFVCASVCLFLVCWEIFHLFRLCHSSPLHSKNFLVNSFIEHKTEKNFFFFNRWGKILCRQFLRYEIFYCNFWLHKVLLHFLVFEIKIISALTCWKLIEKSYQSMSKIYEKG